MAKIRTLYGEKKTSSFPNEEKSLFTGDDHLQIHLVNTSGVEGVDIWVTRKDTEDKTAKPYETYADTVGSSTYAIFVDGKTAAWEEEADNNFQYTNDGTIEKFGIIDSEGEYEKNIFNLKLNPSPHTILLNLKSLTYGTIYKFGKYSQTKPLASTKQTWLENKVSLNASIKGNIISGSSWISFSDDVGKDIVIKPNTSTSTRSGTIVYELKLSDTVSSISSIITINIEQHVYRAIELRMRMQGNAEDEKMLLPIGLTYSASNIKDAYWDTLSVLNTYSAILLGESSKAWDNVDVKLEDKTVNEGTYVGSKNSDISYRWMQLTYPSFNIVKGSDKEETVPFVYEIKPINLEEHIARFVTGLTETGEYDWGEAPYYSFDEYSPVYAVFRYSFRDKNDMSIKQTDEENLKNALPILNKIEKLADGDTVMFAPFSFETTTERAFVFYNLENLQEGESTTYDWGFDGKTITTGKTDPSVTNDIIIAVDETNLPLENLDENNFFLDDATMLEGSSPFYCMLNEIKQNLKIIAEFTEPNKGTLKGDITYSPLIYNVNHTASYLTKFNKEEVVQHNYLTEDEYEVLRYELATETEKDIPWPDAIDIDNIPYTYDLEKHKSEEAEIEFYAYTAAIDNEKSIPRKMFVIKLVCPFSEPHRIVWNGYKDDDVLPLRGYEIGVRVNIDDIGTAMVVSDDNTAVNASSTTTEYASVRIGVGETYTLSGSTSTSEGYHLAYWQNDETEEVIGTGDVVNNITCDKEAKYTAFYMPKCECEHDRIIYVEVTSNIYTVPSDEKLEGIHFLYSIKNNSGEELTVYYPSYSNNKIEFKIPKDKIGEVSMLYSNTLDIWISNTEILK